MDSDLTINGASAKAGDAVPQWPHWKPWDSGCEVRARDFNQIRSDIAPFNGMIAELIKAVPETHVLRDPTRGGLATTLVEIANKVR